ncbi:HEXXH motif-containing putative peptide modification protein [Stella sp.]|uniref:aKG-HExxH-type peptide beta-hydroxylase n=1 Tax=Stella sp. TaxID=2912054 RepID=UPI0035B1B4AB
MFAFQPDPDRGRRLDREVRADFAASLATVLAAVAEQGGIDAATADRIVAALDEDRAAPGLIVAYAGLVEAIFGDRPDQVEACVAALVAAARPAPEVGIRFATLDDATLGAGQAERYRGLFDDDPASPLAIAPLDPDALDRARALGAAGLDLLDRGVPELAGEVRAILREIVFARGTPAPGEETFQGASTFLAWGAVLLNATEQPDRVALAESLAHETGHSILSGFSRGAPLVANADAERHASPLRTDPRPLDGIVHATYVLARMHYCLDRLIASGVLTADEQAKATAARADRRRAFAAGLGVVDAHARLTEIGRSAFEPARAYMAGLPG